MVVNRAMLAPLVRQTALNANRAVRYSTTGYGRPYPTRKKYIDEICLRHQEVTSAHDFFAKFFPGL